MTAHGRLAAAITAVLAMIAAGAASGFVWLQVATPARWRYSEAGLVLTESAAGRQFGIVAWFVLIGVVVSLVFGWVLERRRSEDGWLLVPVTVIATLLAALVCARVGLVFGPPDPRSVTGIEVGDTVPLRFELGAFSPMLMWTVGGLLGVAASLFLRPADRSPSGPVMERAPQSSPVGSDT